MKRQLLFFSFLAMLTVNSILAQSIQMKDDGACYTTSVQTYNYSSSDGGSPARNIYTGTSVNGNVPMRVIWSSTNNEWEMQTFVGGSWVRDYYNSTSSIPNPPALSFGTWVSDGCGVLTQFDGTGTQTVLPVELLTFDVQTTEGGKTNLTWTTNSEINNYAFDIERSRDGVSFTTIGNVKAIGKAGNYNFTDAEPFNGTNYYRLRQIDNDGTETYSKVVSVTNKGGKSLKVYPTLVSNGFLTVVIARDEATEGGNYAIFNIVGQQVQNGKTTQRIDVSALAKGTYILKVGTEQAKFIKQ